jgi:hypothetical protein
MAYDLDSPTVFRVGAPTLGVPVLALDYRGTAETPPVEVPAPPPPAPRRWWHLRAIPTPIIVAPPLVTPTPVSVAPPAAPLDDQLDRLWRSAQSLAALPARIAALEARVAALERPWYRRLWAWFRGLFP